MKLLKSNFFLFVIAFTLTFALRAEEGGYETMCNNLLPVELGEPFTIEFEAEQQTAYLSFTADYENIEFLIDQGIYNAEKKIKSIAIYNITNSCTEAVLIDSAMATDSLTLNERHYRGLMVNDQYALKIDREEARSSKEYGFQLKSLTIGPCPSDYNLACYELATNGGFTYFTENPVNWSVNERKDPFNYLKVCGWTDGDISPSFTDSNGDYSAIMWNNTSQRDPWYPIRYSNETIVKEISLESSKTYNLSFKLKDLQISGFPMPDRFIVRLIKSVDLPPLNITTLPASRNNGFSYRTHSPYEEILSLTNAQFDQTGNWKTFSVCFTPNDDYDRIAFYPYDSLPEPNSGHLGQQKWIGFDDLSVKDISADAGEDISSCEASRVIGPQCVIPGATYSWTPTTGLSDSSTANPTVSASSNTTYTLSVNYPGTSCQSTDQVTVYSSVNNSAYDYVIPNGADVNWVVNNMTPTAQADHVFSNYTIYLDGDLSIDAFINGNQLTFKNCNIFVHRDGEVTIGTGIGLVLDNTTMTVCGDYLWNGIRMHGDSALAQSQQPRIELKNNSEISYAKIGISNCLINVKPWNVYVPHSVINYGRVSGTGGGYIKCRDSKFLNNDLDLTFNSYANVSGGVLFSDLTEIYNTEFITTEQSPYGLRSFFKQMTYRITMQGVYGIKLGGCTFKNTDLLNEDWNRGSAIWAGGASFSLFDYNDNGITVRSSIVGFYNGVISGMNMTNSLYIAKTDFSNNMAAINIGGGDMVSIFKNTFDIPKPNFSANGSYIGVNISGGNEYYIDENDFSHSGANPAYTAVGMVISQIDNFENVIYNNSFENLNVGTLVMGDNRDANGQGLVIKCNDYNANNYHVALEPIPLSSSSIPPEIAVNQGGNGNQADPAGNTFNNLCSGSAETDISVASTGSAFNYFHHADAITTPVCRTSAKVNGFDTQLFYASKETACPSNFAGGGGGGDDFEPGLGLARQNASGLATQLRSLKASDKSGGTQVEKLISSYYAAQLMSDTIQLDSIIHYLSQSNNPFNQLRAVAAMQLKGDTTLARQKAALGKLSPQAQQLIQQHTALQQNRQKTLAGIKNDPAHPLYIWAKVKAFVEDEEPLPFPIKLPEPKAKPLLTDNQTAELIVYPLPADHQLQLKDAKQQYALARLVNMEGKVLKTISLEFEQKIHTLAVNDLPNGVYVLQLIEYNGGLKHEKISIQH